MGFIIFAINQYCLRMIMIQLVIVLCQNAINSKCYTFTVGQCYTFSCLLIY